MLSVIIPVLNASAFLPDLLRRVKAGLMPGEEIFVVDDGSTDDSAALARQILDRHERLSSRLVTTPNGGQSAARNHGVTLARRAVPSSGRGPFVGRPA